jgi:hypothetical protein
MLTVDLTTMPNLVNLNDSVFVVHQVENSIVALADSKNILAKELLAPGRTWLHPQPFDPLQDSAQIRIRQAAKSLFSAALEP